MLPLVRLVGFLVFQAHLGFVGGKVLDRWLDFFGEATWVMTETTILEKVKIAEKD